MEPSRFHRLSELFLRAAELDDDDRSAFLDEECGDDLEMRRDVDSLLRHDREGESLRTGVFGRVHDEPEPAPAGIGPYVVQETLGEGGMGVVYRACQESPFRREVAVKLLRRGLESDLFVSRFESERQALATMNHVNVASVYDAGLTDDGRPYFAMELVVGEPIIEFCTSRELDLEARIALFRQVCEGVQHAHQKGIIHRDLKPSNVLVTVDSGSPIPKIIDFGVAKTLDRALASDARRTEAWMLLGTPEYMSPEHALLGPAHVDTRSDVYSLGVILYELVTGRLPIDGEALRHSSFFEMCRAIREDVPARPSVRVANAHGKKGNRAADDPRLARRVRELRGDIDWITMKSLEKDPARRYSTPTELANDLARHIAFEPVAARPPSRVYRLRKYVRKHRTAFVLASALLLAVVTLASLATGQSVRASREAARAEREARAAADTAEFLIGIFGRSPPYYERGGRQTIRKALDDAVRSIRRDLADQPVMQARLLHAVGDAHRREGRRVRARPLLEEARALLSEHLGDDHETTQLAAESLARVHLYSGRAAESERLIADILERRRSAYGDDDPRVLKAIVSLGVVYRTTRRNQEAAGLLETAIAGLERQDGEHDRAVRAAQGHLASTYMDLGRYAEARDLLVELVEVLPASLGELKAETMIARYNLGCVHANLGDRDAALTHLRKAIKDGFSYPGSMYQDPHVAPLMDDPEFEALERVSRLNGMSRDPPAALAKVKIATGRHREAERLLNEMLDSIGFGRERERTALTPVPLELLTGLYLREGRFDEAEASAREWIDAIEKSAYIGDRQLAAPLLHLAQCLLARDDTSGALELIDRSLEIVGLPDRQAYAKAVRFALDGAEADALEALRTAAELGYSDPDWIRNDVAFEALRGEPEFASILARMERNTL